MVDIQQHFSQYSCALQRSVVMRSANRAERRFGSKPARDLLAIWFEIVDTQQSLHTHLLAEYQSALR